MGSPAATRWQPNERLLAQRLRRGWSLEDVVRELCDLAIRVGERPLARILELASFSENLRRDREMGRQEG